MAEPLESLERNFVCAPEDRRLGEDGLVGGPLCRSGRREDASMCEIGDTVILEKLPPLIYEELVDKRGDPYAELEPRPSKLPPDSRRRREREIRKVQERVLASLKDARLPEREDS